MDESGRLLNCARCHSQVIVCRRCDRGQVYCNGNCSRRARRESLKRASRLYQSSRRGRMVGARRQQRFRERQRQKVTHQGSAASVGDDLLSIEQAEPSETNRGVNFAYDTGTYCHFCRRECGPFLRNHFFRPSMRR